MITSIQYSEVFRKTLATSIAQRIATPRRKQTFWNPETEFSCYDETYVAFIDNLLWL